MRILLLNQYYPPDTSATAAMASRVAESLSARHDVVVVAGRPSYAPKERHPFYLLRKETRAGIAVERVGATAFHRGRMGARLANFLSYLALTMARVLTIRPGPDVIIAMTDPPLICLVGALASLIRRCRFVYNIRDLHPEMAVVSGVLKPGLFVSLWDRLHSWALKRADLAIVLGEDMRDRVLAKGVSPDRVVIVRDGAEPHETCSAGDHPVTREIRGDSAFVVLHAGNLGFAGSWDTILEAARRLESGNTDFVFVGDGAQRPAVQERANGLGNVRFLPFYSQQLLPQVLGAADLHLVTIRRGLEGLVVPSKLYPILAAGRPVLAVAPPESDVARIVQSYGCGLVADPDDPAEVAEAIRRVQADRGLLDEMARRAKDAGLAFDQQSELERFSRLVEDVGVEE